MHENIETPHVEVGVYRGHKGGLYRVLGSWGINKTNGPDDDKPMVRYIDEPPKLMRVGDGYEIAEYYRTSEQFLEEVPDLDDPDQTIPRFAKIR